MKVPTNEEPIGESAEVPDDQTSGSMGESMEEPIGVPTEDGVDTRADEGVAHLTDPSIDSYTFALWAQKFKEVTSACCPSEMEIFFRELLDSMNFEVCSAPHVQGLMHWFTCVPDMDFQYVYDVIMHGNPCKFWAPKGQECPTLSAECAGEWCR